MRTNNFHSKCFWQFGPNNSFKSSCNCLIDFNSSKKYDWTIGDEIYLNILHSEKEATASFKLDTLTSNKLELEYHMD